MPTCVSGESVKFSSQAFRAYWSKPDMIHNDDIKPESLRKVVKFLTSVSSQAKAEGYTSVH